MPKINREEYEILKSLDEKWEWIARDKDRGLYAFTEKPVRKYDPSPYWDTKTEEDYSALELFDEIHLFQFIQWEDEEPHNIAELIEEYEDHEFYDYVGWEYYESEETEVKTLESIRDEIWEEMLRLEDKRIDQWADIKYQTLREVLQKLGHLDEPEVLSQEWIDRFEQFRAYVQEQRDLSYGVELGATGGYTGRIANQYDGLLEMIEEYEEHNPIALQNLLVPKQELPVIPKFVADWIDTYQKYEDIYTALSVGFEGMESVEVYNWLHDCKGVENQETFARAWLDGFKVEEEQKYYAKLKEIKPLEKEWLTNLSGPNYYALDTKGLMLGEFILDLVGMKTEASTHTLKNWERHGINDSNADFVKVEELEE